MSTDVTMTMGDSCDASIGRNGGHTETMGINGYYKVECRNAQGDLKWEDEIHNLVTTLGKNIALTSILTNTSQGAVAMGLKGSGTPNATNTQATKTWTEVGGANTPTYSGARKPVTFTAAGSAQIQSNGVLFTFTNVTAADVYGCFINIGASSTTKDGTADTLFSAGDFTGGAKSVVQNDTLTVTYTASIAA